MPEWVRAELRAMGYTLEFQRLTSGDQRDLVRLEARLALGRLEQPRREITGSPGRARCRSRGRRLPAPAHWTNVRGGGLLLRDRAERLPRSWRTGFPPVASSAWRRVRVETRCTWPAGCRGDRVDVSAPGLDKTRALAAERGVKVHTVHADLADGPSARCLGCGGRHLLSPPAGDPGRCAPASGGCLRPEGLFVLEAYTPEQLRYETGAAGRGTADAGGGPAAELAGLELEIAREVEREIHEGRGHTGGARWCRSSPQAPGGLRTVDIARWPTSRPGAPGFIGFVMFGVPWWRSAPAAC